jgi:integrase
MGRDQLGWLEKAGGCLYGCFRTHWKIPDGESRTWREWVELGSPSVGTKAAKRMLIGQIQEFFNSRLQAAGMPAKATGSDTFSWLLARVEETRRADWKPNTARINTMYLKVLRDKLGRLPIQDFGTVEMQDYLRGWLQELAKSGLSRSYVQHVLIYLRAALNEALKRQLVHYNYANELKLPARMKKIDQRYLTEDQVALLVKHLRANGQRRDALIVLLFYLCALRPGELFALRWNDWDPATRHLLRIDEAFGKSGLDDPKTPRSNSYVYLPPTLQSELESWKAWSGNVAPESWIFTAKRKTPIRYDNYLKRTLQPAATASGIGEITHQMLRRTFSTMAVDRGASVKDVQAQMRHTQASMTAYYAKSIPRSVAEEVDKLSAAVLAKTE